MLMASMRLSRRFLTPLLLLSLMSGACDKKEGDTAALSGTTAASSDTGTSADGDTTDGDTTDVGATESSADGGSS